MGSEREILSIDTGPIARAAVRYLSEPWYC
jgi:hypothetical protein